MDTHISPSDHPVSETPAQRLFALRGAMSKIGIDGYLVPHGDEHQGEFNAPYGSAGLSVVLTARAVIFVDGRYTLQVKTQVDGALYEYAHLADDPPGKWLAQNLPKGTKLGFDPRLHTPTGLARLEEAALRAGAELVPVAENLIDKVWREQPARPAAPISIYPVAFAEYCSRPPRR